MKYDVITSNTVPTLIQAKDDLVKKVNEAMENGWEPIGNTNIIEEHGLSSAVFYTFFQSVINYKLQEEKPNISERI